MQAPRGSLGVPVKTGGHVQLTLLVTPVLTRRLFGGIDLPGNVLFVIYM